MSIVITGHKGGAGSVIVNNLRNKGLNYSFYDTSNSISSSTKIVIHTAAKHPIDTNQEVFKSNIIFQMQIVDNCQEVNAKLLFLSSVSVYGFANRLVDESTKISPDSFYGLTKFYGEKYADLKHLSGYSLRLPALLTVNNNNLMSRIADKLIKGKVVELLNPDLPFNSYADPEEIAEFASFCKFNKSFEIVNFAVNPSLTLYETVCILKEMLFSKSIIKKGHEDGMHRVYSNTKVKKLTDFEFSNPEYILERWVQKIKKEKFFNA